MIDHGFRGGPPKIRQLHIRCSGTACHLSKPLEFLRRFLGDSRHRFIPDDLSVHDRVLRTDLMASANYITDHYLVALARQHGVTLGTLDEPLARLFASESALVQLIR